MKALSAGLSVEGITMYLFWLGIVGMGAGALYLFMMQGSLTKTYKKVAIVAGITITGHESTLPRVYYDWAVSQVARGLDGTIVVQV